MVTNKRPPKRYVINVRICDLVAAHCEFRESVEAKTPRRAVYLALKKIFKNPRVRGHRVTEMRIGLSFVKPTKTIVVQD